MWCGGRLVSILIVACLLVSACSGPARAPVVSPGEYKRSAVIRPGSINKPDYYVVQRGDTLYSIAWNFGLDYRDVSAWNKIRPPYTIYPGQKIRLKPASKRNRAATEKRPAKRQSSPSVSGNQRKHSQADRPANIVSSGPVKWNWPTMGKVIDSDSPISKNGIDIAGKLNQPVNAAADGIVVYSGSGLLGYGKLIIIKHNEVYLSAYAHNSRLLVKEGQRVAAGQHIAYMGKTSNGRVLLHFEIRKNGQPDNPLKYLPRR